MEGLFELRMAESAREQLLREKGGLSLGDQTRRYYDRYFKELSRNYDMRQLPQRPTFGTVQLKTLRVGRLQFVRGGVFLDWPNLGQ